MSGTDQSNSSDNKDCHHSKEDSIEECVAAMARLSISDSVRQRSPPLRAARNKDPQKPTKVTLSRLPGTISGKSQVKPPKRRWEDVSSEEDIWAGTKRHLGSINQEEPEPNVQQEVEKTECERTEKAKKPKPRRGGVIHRSENNCCPALPSSRPLPRSHRDLQMEDIRAAGHTLCPRSYWL